MHQKRPFGRDSRPGFSNSRRPQYGGGRGGSRGGPRKGFLNLNAFINKAVTVEETEAHFIPEHQFTDFPIHDRLKKSIVQKGYLLPTPIQDRAISPILQGKDVVGIANTGTGKTAAFLIPLINKVLNDPKQKVLVMVPTRELAIQINQELKGFAPNLGIFSTCLVGGINIGPQLRELKHNNQFFIGTPGRIKDVIKRGALNLSQVQNVVLDEADRMLDMGFIVDMRYIVSLVPKERQTLFFSATMSPEIDRLVREFLRDPITISVKTRDTSANIDQDVVRKKPGQEKFDALHELLKLPEFKKVLVFGQMKHSVQKLATGLESRGIKADSIHGNKSHSQRQRALDRFKRGEIQTLVATDVAARGLDIPNVSHVINYDLPTTYADYIHRIGRTGRGAMAGKALTFVD